MNAKRFLAAKVVGAVILTVAAGTAAAADGMGRKPATMVCPMAKPADAPQAATKQPGRTEGKTVTRKTAKDSSPAAAAPSSKSGGRTATKTTSKSDANPTGRSVRKSASAAPAKETAGPRKKTGDSKADVGKNAGVRDRVA